MSKKNFFKSCTLTLMLSALMLSSSAYSQNVTSNTEKQSSTSDDEQQSATTLTATVTEDQKHGSAILSLSEDDFNAAGFAFGDSCSLVFSNGYTLDDVPYYNGYYVKTGSPVIVAYPGNDYVKIALNSGEFWTAANLEEGCTVEITCQTAGKYLSTYEVLGINYSTDRSDYESDEAFANFRAISVSTMKENFVYRGASPVNNEKNRASIVDDLLEENGISYIIDLADSDEEMQAYFDSEDFDSEYTKSLYEEGYDIVLSMGVSYSSDSYKASVAEGMRHLLKYGGPVYIHCTEGKDRTGFVCTLLEALVGTGYDEMCQDYMTSYKNYYNVTEDETPDSYNAIVSLYFDSFMEYLYGTDDLETLKAADYTESAKKYLTDCGMTEDEIEQLIVLLSKDQTGLANPWTQSDEQGVAKATGFEMTAPDEATDVSYSYMSSDGLAQMQFTLDGMKWVYRIQMADELTDISGMEYQWTDEIECSVSDRDAVYYSYVSTGNGKEENAQLVNWYDAVTGVTYSLSATGKELSDTEMLAYAEDLYAPLQGDVTGD